MMTIIDFILHIDKHLAEIASDYGATTLIILALIVFAETGLVIIPFLPGDSLLFAAGALSAKGFYSIESLIIVLFIAAVVGDTVNYHIGKYIGPKVFERESRFIKRAHLLQTQKYFEKYGGKTIIIARFVPIVRTFAPFLAGVGTMNYRTFIAYNVIGGALWVVSLCLAGYYFGALPFVEKNFSLVVFAIIIISVLPIVFEYIKHRKEKSST